MAIWFSLKEAVVVLTILCGILRCEEDLLEDLKPKRDDPPELTEFLQSVLHKKDEFKKIRDAARRLQLQVSSTNKHKQPTANFNRLEDNLGYPSQSALFNKQYKRDSRQYFKRNLRNSDKPVNDVYPYLYDGSEPVNEVEQDEREERSPWREYKEKKAAKRNQIRFRRGLDLNDYKSDSDIEVGNIKIFPRSRSGVRNVPGNKYEQKRGSNTNHHYDVSKQKEANERSTQLTHSNYFLPDLSSKWSKERPKINNEYLGVDNEITKNTRFKNQPRDFKKRSMKLNIIDNGNLIRNIQQDERTKSVILTLKNENANNFEQTSKKVNLQQLLKSNNQFKESKLNNRVPNIIYAFQKPKFKVAENEEPTRLLSNFRTYELDNYNRDAPKEGKKNTLQDVDEPTSAIEQHQLSTKPIGDSPGVTDEISLAFDVIKEASEPTSESATSSNNLDHFVVKETKDMVHGKNVKGFTEKRNVEADHIIENNYRDVISHLKNKLDNYKQNFNDHNFIQEKQLLDELSNLKKRVGKQRDHNLKAGLDNDYYNQNYNSKIDINNFRSRKLQFFVDDNAGGMSSIIKPEIKRSFTSDNDYIEDNLNEMKFSNRRQRSDDSYEEEGDSDIGETQIYASKKQSNQNKSDSKFINDENGDDTEDSFVSPNLALSVNTKDSNKQCHCNSENKCKTCQIKYLDKNENKIGEPTKEPPKNNEFKPLHYKHNYKVNGHHSHDSRNLIQNEPLVEEENNELANLKEEKKEYSDNYDENDDVFQLPRQASDKQRAVKKQSDYEKFITAKVEIQERQKYIDHECNATKLQLNKTHVSNTATELKPHNKTVAKAEMNTNLKTIKQEPNEEVEFKFDKLNKTTNICEFIDNLSNHTTKSASMHHSVTTKATSAKLHEMTSKSPALESNNKQHNSAAVGTLSNTAEFAHHPIPNKKPNSSSKSEPKTCPAGKNATAVNTKTLTKFNAEYNQNNIRRDTPELETIGSSYNNIQNEVKDIYSDLIIEKPLKNDDVIRKRKKPTMSDEDDSYSEFSIYANKLQNDAELQNAIDSNKRYAFNNGDVQNLYAHNQNRRRMRTIAEDYSGPNNNIEAINDDVNINDAPFEEYSKLNEGYWKNYPVGRIEKRRQLINNAFFRNPNLFKPKRFRRDRFSKFSIIEKRDSDLSMSNKKNDKVQALPVQERELYAHNKQKSKSNMKEWISPNMKKKGKECFLGKESGDHPDMSMKSSGADSKESCPDNEERGTKDYGQMHDALNGHLACVIVEVIFKKVKNHQSLHKRFSHGLYRKHGYKSEMKDLNAFRNSETEGDIKHTEQMLHQIMTVLNKIVLDQVRRRTCKHLSPELQKYLRCLTTTTTKPVEDEETKISEEGFPLPLVKTGKSKEKIVDTEQGGYLFDHATAAPELEQNEVEIRKKIKMIRKMLDKYKHMSAQCRVKVEDVEAYLKKHLVLLRKMLKHSHQEKCDRNKNPESFPLPPKLKRKNYDMPPFSDLEDVSHLNRQELIKKQLDSVGLGSSNLYKPSFNLDQLIQDNINKIKHSSNSQTKITSNAKPKSNYLGEDDIYEKTNEDYENLKNEYKREVRGSDIELASKPVVSEKYKKLVEAAESFRRKRETEDRLGELFGKTDERSNEGSESNKFFNKDDDFSHVRFESPVVFSLK